MNFTNLPLLCIDQIISHLSQENIIRRPCDIICDCIALSATSKDVNANLSRPLAFSLSPMNDYEKLRTNSDHKDLRKACRSNNLYSSGNNKVLLERLKHRLNDPRSKHCHLGHRILKTSKYERTKKFHQHEGFEILDKFGLRRKNLAYTFDSQHGKWNETFHSFVRKILAQYQGDDRLLFAARPGLIEERLVESNIRSMQLKHAMDARGCELRPDSEISDAFLRDSPNARSLAETVEFAEEMQFFYTMTSYPTILRSNRALMGIDGCSDDDVHGDDQYDGHRSKDDEKAYTEKRNRDVSKEQAIGGWLRENCWNIDYARRLMPQSIGIRYLSKSSTEVFGDLLGKHQD